MVLSHNTHSPKWEIEGIVWRDQTTSAKETTVSMVVMHSILTLKYLDNRDSMSHNICVSSDKLGFFSCLSAILSIRFFNVMLFWVTKMKTLRAQTVLSQPTKPKNNSCMLRMPVFQKEPVTGKNHPYCIFGLYLWSIFYFSLWAKNFFYFSLWAKIFFILVCELKFFFILVCELKFHDKS